MQKKLIALLLAFACVFSFVVSCGADPIETTTESTSATTAETSEKTDVTGEKTDVTTLVSSKDYTVYGGDDATVVGEVQLTFFTKESKDIQDIPYIEVKHAFDFINNMRTFDLNEFDCVERLSFNYEETQKGVVRTSIETTFRNHFIFDANKNEITIFSPESFLSADYKPVAYSPIDLFKDEVGYRYYIPYELTARSTYGKEVVICLDDYDITLIENDGSIYLPLQTFADLFLAISALPSVVFNGEAVFAVGSSDLLAGNELTETGKLYYGVEKKEFSDAYRLFSYNELCLLLDFNYGLKDQHRIDGTFDEYLTQIGFKQVYLESDDAGEECISYLVMQNFADRHSSYGFGSYADDYDHFKQTQETIGGALIDNYLVSEYLMAYRRLAYPEGVPGYEVLDDGKTAFITFDSFKMPEKDVDYYKNKPTSENYMDDTVALLLYAKEQLTIVDTDVVNIVVDLSCNGGGAANAAAFVVAALIGSSSNLSTVHTTTGSAGTCAYVADLNLDHEFETSGTRDNFSNYHIYCLISGSSFSCGNLVPNILQDSGKVTLIGQTSGGGACAVLPCSTALGVGFNISSPMCLSVAKNGSYYDIDRGATPNILIDRWTNFYGTSDAPRAYVIDLLHK